MAKRSIRAARLLAHHTQEVSRHTASGEAVTVMDLIERQLARRAEHAAAIALIDGELTRVYERLAADVPVGVKPSPSPMSSLQAAELAGAAAAARRIIPVTTVVRPAAPVRPSESGRRQAKAASATDGATATIIAAVLAAVRAGHETPGDIRRAVVSSGHAAWRVKGALQFCVVQGTLRLSGRTSASRYTLAPEHAAPPAAVPSSRRAVVDEGVEFEPVWTGAKTDPSLLGDRAQRGHVLA